MPLVIGVAATARALTHRTPEHAQVGRLRDAELAVSMVAVGYGLLALVATLAQPVRLLLATTAAVLYITVDAVLTEARARLGVRTTTMRVRQYRVVAGADVGDVVEGAVPGVRAPVKTLLRPPSGGGMRARGASVAGTLLVMGLLTHTERAAAVALHVPGLRAPPRGESSQPREPEPLKRPSPAPTASTSASPSTAAASPVKERRLSPTYDELCGRGADQPGDGAPDWAAPALHQLWLGVPGAGAQQAGCVSRAVPLPDRPDVVFQTGSLYGRLLGVAVSVRGKATTLYINGSAARVLGQLRDGIVPVGPDLRIVTVVFSSATSPSPGTS